MRTPPIRSALPPCATAVPPRASTYVFAPAPQICTAIGRPASGALAKGSQDFPKRVRAQAEHVLQAKRPCSGESLGCCCRYRPHSDVGNPYKVAARHRGHDCASVGRRTDVALNGGRSGGNGFTRPTVAA